MSSYLAVLPKRKLNRKKCERNKRKDELELQSTYGLFEQLFGSLCLFICGRVGGGVAIFLLFLFYLLEWTLDKYLFDRLIKNKFGHLRPILAFTFHLRSKTPQ